MISAVVLAAGHTLPAGEQSSSSLLHHKPVLQWILESALASVADEVICVTNDLSVARREILLTDPRLIWHLNSAAASGQSTFVIAGLWSSHPESDGVMFVADDLPLVRTELINSLIERFENSAAWIVAASSGGRPSNPILFRRDLFPELLGLTGNDKGYSLLDKHAKETTLVEWHDENARVNGEWHRASERLKERV